jgi:hypothetical protein
LEDSGVKGRIILKLTFRNRIGAWTGLIWLKIGTGIERECGDKLSVSIK